MTAPRDGLEAAASSGLLGRLRAIRKNGPAAYSLSVICFTIGLGARFAADDLLPEVGYPFLTFFPAVVVSAFFGGLGPGLLSAALSTVAAWYYFIPPARSFRIETNGDLVALVFFVVVLLVDCVVIHGMNVSLDRVREERETNAELARQLELRLVELRAANERTEAASRAKSRMMASVGHDLKQPLNVISMAVQLLGADAQHPRQQELMARTRRNLASLARSFDMLLEAARLESDAFRPTPTELDLASLLAQINDEYAALAAEKSLRFEAPASDVHVTSDRALLLSILRNFVGNAIKYTPSGGSIRVEVTATPTHALIEVVDTGPGIPPDKIDVIFGEFERLEEGKKEEGIGLGLSLVKRSAELLHHRVVVSSTPGQGSRFGVEVERAQAA